MKTMKTFSAIAVITLLLFTGCGINRQLELAKAFENCEYTVVSADSVTVAGMDLAKIKTLNTGDLSRMPKIALALLTQNVPLRGRVNLRITNPSSKMAGINQFEY